MNKIHDADSVALGNAIVGGEILNESTQTDFDMVMDIPVQMTVELGRTQMTIKQLCELAQGSVIELDGLAGQSLNVLVNDCLIAQGEVVVVNDKFGIRLTDIIGPAECLKKTR